MNESMRIGFLGAGAMTRALAPRWSAAGHDVVIGGRDPATAERVAVEVGLRGGSLRAAAEHVDVAVLAVRWEGVDWTLDQVRDALRGTVLVDVTNPVETECFTLATPPGTSLAERVERETGARVVKAFNLAQASVWTAPRQVDGAPMAVPIATDHEEARRVAAALAAALGMTAVDVGGLHHAAYLEAMAALVIRRLFAGDPLSSTFAWVA